MTVARKLGVTTIALAILALGATMAVTQERFRGRRQAPVEQAPDNVPYDGRFTFARIRFEAALGSGVSGAFFGGNGEPPWAHDYPLGERHFTRMLAELTSLQVRVDESNIFTLDDPDLFKFPVAYMCEPGYWYPTDEEAEGLRNYLSKGGFMIVDDFVSASQWQPFENGMRKVFPKVQFIPLTTAHPIFDSFYRIESLEYDHPVYSNRGFTSQFLGVFEDNDPSKRMLMIINFNNDISEYWEFSNTGFFPIDLSNTAYKIGINYVAYALTR